MSCGRYQILVHHALHMKAKIATIQRMRSVAVKYLLNPSPHSSFAVALVATALFATSLALAQATTPPPATETPTATPPPTDPPIDAPTAPTPPPVFDVPLAVNGARVYVIVDRFSEFGGTVVSQTPLELVLKEPSGRMRTILKARIFEVVPLLDEPKRTRVEVEFRDGRRQVGLLLDDGFESLTIEIGGISTTYKRELIMRTLAIPTDEELYQRAKESIEPDQYSARLSLCSWLYERKMYEECHAELLSLLEATDNFEAKQLLKEVKAQLVVIANAAARLDDDDATSEDDAETPESKGPRDRAAEQLKGRILTADEVNLIRVYEMDLEHPPKVEVDDSLIRTIFEKYATDALVPSSNEARAAWFTKEPIEVVKLLFALKARELYPRIDVQTEPSSLNVFRTKIHNAWLINNCATSRCHGGVDAGRFILHTRDWKSVRVRYTNLLVLERTTLDGRPLIDFDEPSMSLLYQMALPRTEARLPHPTVRGWEPVFTPGRRALAEDFLLWARDMRMPRPVYPIEYEPPRLRETKAVGSGGNDR